MSGFIFGERRVGKMSPLEGQRCSNAFSNEQGSDIRHTCLGNDGGVWAKHRKQTLWVDGRNSEGAGLWRNQGTHPRPD